MRNVKHTPWNQGCSRIEKLGHKILIMKTVFSNNKVKIRGKIVEGLRVAADFTQIPWVRKQFISKLSIDPYLETLNLEIVNPDPYKLSENSKRWKE